MVREQEKGKKEARKKREGVVYLSRGVSGDLFKKI